MRLFESEQPITPTAKKINTVKSEPIPRFGHVLLPKEYKRYAPKFDTIHKDDLQFFKGLEGKYRKDPSTSQEQDSHSEQDLFFAAATELLDHGLELRAEESKYRSDGDRFDMRQEHYRQSNIRTTTLAALFIHHPLFRGTYRKIHAEKMERALPQVATALTDIPDDEIYSLDGYFENTQEILASALEETSYTFPQSQVNVIGNLAAFDNHGFIAHKSLTRTYFAATGIGTFRKFLQEVVTEAAETGEDIPAAVRHEFLDRDGVGFQLMRTHLHDFAEQHPIELEGKPLDEQRKTLETTVFTQGSCPAIHKMPGADGTQRPIVYEYAATIVDKIPQRILDLYDNKKMPNFQDLDAPIEAIQVDWAGENESESGPRTSL